MYFILEDVSFTTLLIDKTPVVKYGDSPEPCLVDRVGLEIDALYLSPLISKKYWSFANAASSPGIGLFSNFLGFIPKSSTDGIFSS